MRQLATCLAIFTTILALPGATSAKGKQALVRANGTTTSLKGLAVGRPTAVVVIKGEWCTVCTDQLRSLSNRIRRIRKGGGEVVGLSTEDPGTNRMLMKRLGLSFEILSDPNGRTLEALGLYLPKLGHPMPGLLFLDRCGDVVLKRPGRRPGRSQDALVEKTLRRLATATTCADRA
jgi:peroxiredoxin